MAQSPLASAAPTDQVLLSDSAIALLQAKNSYQANLATIKIADAMQKSALSLTDPNARARNPG